MKKFLTLVKRDLTDYRGALFITPFAIAAFILLVALIATLTGKSTIVGGQNFNIGSVAHDKGVNIVGTDEDGHKYRIFKNEAGTLMKEVDGVQTPVIGKLSQEEKKEASDAVVIGSALASGLPVGVAAVAIYFILAGALFDERKERNIMFWKSLPISDIQTVGAKAVSTIGGGFGLATLASMALQIGLLIIILANTSIIGLDVFDLGSMFGSFFKVWGVLIIGILVAALWALPIYAWFLTMSAYAPKSPFFAALLPIAILPIVIKIFFEDVVSYAMIPLQHMTAEPVWKSLGQALDFQERNIDKIDASQISAMPILETMAQPQFIIGLLVAGGLFYLASEIRRRKAL